MDGTKSKLVDQSLSAESYGSLKPLKKYLKNQLLQISGSGSNLSIYFPFNLDFFRSMACLSVSDVYRERRINNNYEQ